MALNINRYNCPDCGHPVEPWLARRPRFSCAGCGRGYCSNYQRSLKRSALAGLLLWLGGLVLGVWLIQPWQMVLAVALELGGFLAFGLAWLWHRHSIRITPCAAGGVDNVSGRSPAAKDPPC
ncbi:MAG: hypothetical protein OQL28_10390 [Sedimenticola sp.]|nr:hypothetical protein [Sedimenticola sp.]